MCHACRRGSQGKTTTDLHHIAGKANNPVTVPVPVNDHRAVLSEAQRDWPKQTLENPDRSPFRAGAACYRGFIDWVVYALETLLWIAELLEETDAVLSEKLGKEWWLDTPLAQFAPQGTDQCED